MGDELRPCPFCGGRAFIDQTPKGEWMVECGGCHGGTGLDSSPEGTVAAWNRRTPDPKVNAAVTAHEAMLAACKAALAYDEAIQRAAAGAILD